MSAIIIVTILGSTILFGLWLVIVGLTSNPAHSSTCGKCGEETEVCGAMCEACWTYETQLDEMYSDIRNEDEIHWV